MKNKFSIVFAALCMTGFSYAHAGVTCMDRHEEDAGKLMTKIFAQGAVAALTKKGIALDSEKTSFEISAAQVDFESDGDYGYFDITDGSMTSKAGTEISLAFDVDSNWRNDQITTYRVYYKPVLKSKGRDKEGNEIEPHCTLVLDDVRVNDKAEFLRVTNTVSGATLATVALPAKVSLY